MNFKNYLLLVLVVAFRAYPELKHNFSASPTEKWNWDHVAHDFFTWMGTH